MDGLLKGKTASRDIVNRLAAGASRREVLRVGTLWLGGVLGLSAAPGNAAQRTAGPVPPAGLSGRALFDGRTLGAWSPVVFGGEGQVRVEDGQVVLERGNDLTGIVWTGDALPPRYTLDVEAMRVEGTDFFCALTFPVAGSHCTFVVGGWGGTLIGLSTLESYDASENETAQVRRLEDGRWYRIRVEVSPTTMRASLDDEVMADITLEGREIDVRPEMELCRPLGIASYRTVAAIRSIRLVDQSADRDAP